VLESTFLLRFLGFCPPRFSGFSGASATLFVGHGFQAALSADLPALTPHLSHDLLNHGKSSNFSWRNRLQNYATRVLYGIKIINSARPLWHTSSVAWMAGGVKA